MAEFSITVPQFVLDAVYAVLPAAYIDWWLNLLHENPTHLYIETTLVSSAAAAAAGDQLVLFVSEKLTHYLGKILDFGHHLHSVQTTQ